MASRPLLNAHDEDPAYLKAELTRLRREVVGLEAELQAAKQEATTVKQASTDAISAIRELRKQTDPIFTALKMIHGEISRVDADAVHSASPSAAIGRDPRWDSWKIKIGGMAAEIIELLLVHKEMNTKQIAAALRCDPRTVKNPIYQLNKATLITKNGGKFSLKDL